MKNKIRKRQLKPSTDNIISKEDLTDIKLIRQIVSNETNISIKLMEGISQAREIVFARQLYCYFCKLLIKVNPNSISLALIGSLVNRDHATVLHSFEAISNLIETNKSIKNKVDIIKEKCETALKIGFLGIPIEIIDQAGVYTTDSSEGVSRLFAYIDKEITIFPTFTAIIWAGLTIKIPLNLEVEIKTNNGEIENYSSGTHDIKIHVTNKTHKEIIIKPLDHIADMFFYERKKVVFINSDFG